MKHELLVGWVEAGTRAPLNARPDSHPPNLTRTHTTIYTHPTPPGLQVRDFLMRVKCGRFPPIEKDFKMVLAHCGSLFLDPAALQLVRRCLFGLFWSVFICVLCAQQPFK